MNPNYTEVFHVDYDCIKKKIQSNLITHYNLEDRIAGQLALEIFDTIEAVDGNLKLFDNLY